MSPTTIIKGNLTELEIINDNWGSYVLQGDLIGRVIFVVLVNRSNLLY